jgi:catechol 2,3-dioxygenase-like lactoylglutathione lyase family enzyme
MTVRLNHTIVVGRDKSESARFLAEILGLPPPRMLGHFAVVQVGDTSLDFVETDGEIAQRHFAFLISEEEFDEIFARIRERNMPFWADPFRREPGRINRWDDERSPARDHHPSLRQRWTRREKPQPAVAADLTGGCAAAFLNSIRID